MTIAVDFDGVIHAYSRGWADGTIYDPPMPGALDGLRELMNHDAVFIFTTRDVSQVAEWLIGRQFNVRIGYDGPFWNERGTLLVTNCKLAATAYLDDRAVRFESWSQALGVLLPDQAAPASQANTGSDGAHHPLPPERPPHGHTAPRYSCTEHPGFTTSCPDVLDQHDREDHADDQQRTVHLAACPAVSGEPCECGALASAMVRAEALPLPRKVCSATRTRNGSGLGGYTHEVCWETYGHAGGHVWRQSPADAATVRAAVAPVVEAFAGTDDEAGCPTPLTHNWGCGCPTDELPAEVEREQQAMADLNGAYRERAQLLAWLATAVPALITEARDTDEPGWQLLYLLPSNTQLSWHISPRDADLFEHVWHVGPAHPGVQWDGHTTEEKYERIALLVANAAEESDPTNPKSWTQHEQREAVRQMARIDPAWARRLLEGTTP